MPMRFRSATSAMTRSWMAGSAFGMGGGCTVVVTGTGGPARCSSATDPLQPPVDPAPQRLDHLAPGVVGGVHLLEPALQHLGADPPAAQASAVRSLAGAPVHDVAAAHRDRAE